MVLFFSGQKIFPLILVVLRASSKLHSQKGIRISNALLIQEQRQVVILVLVVVTIIVADGEL